MSGGVSRSESNAIKSQGAATVRASKRLETLALRDNPQARKLTPEVKMQIVGLIAQGHGFAKTCKAFGVSTVSTYSEAKKDPAFKMLLDEARVAAKEGLEESLYERAKRSDTTAGIFLLKAMDPDRYGDKMRIDATHRLEINVSLIPADETIDATRDAPETLEAAYEVQSS